MATARIRAARLFLAGTLALLLGGAFNLVGASATAGPAPASPPLSDYVLYGQHGVWLGVGTVINGLVGAEDGNLCCTGTGANPDRSIGLNGSAQINGDARGGENIYLGTNASITGTLIRTNSSTLNLNGGASVGSDTHYDTVDFPTFPGPTALTCPTGGPNQGSGSNGQTLNLTAGTYGTITTGGTSTINLTTAGDYYFQSVDTGNSVNWNILATPVHVYVCDDMNLGSGADVLPTSLDPGDVSWEVQSTDKHNAFVAGGSSDWIGDVFAPNGGIHLGSGGGVASFSGRLWAQLIDMEHGVDGTGPEPTPTPTPSATPTESPTPSPSATPTESPTATPSATPSATPTDSPTATPSATPSATPTDSPTATPSATPSATPTDSPTATPSATPTGSPTPSPTPTLPDTGGTPTPTPTLPDTAGGLNGSASPADPAGNAFLLLLIGSVAGLLFMFLPRKKEEPPLR
jgi:hypothetical protein